LDEDEEADGLYEPESSCMEIPGLSEEEEPVPNRKIQFSTAPIQVSAAVALWGPRRREKRRVLGVPNHPAMRLEAVEADNFVPVGHGQPWAASVRC